MDHVEAEHGLHARKRAVEIEQRLRIRLTSDGYAVTTPTLAGSMTSHVAFSLEDQRELVRCALDTGLISQMPDS